MNLNELIQKYQEIRRKIKALEYATWMISWDTETEAPKGALEYRATQIGTLSEEIYKLSTSKELQEIVASLLDQKEQLAENLAREMYLVNKSIRQYVKIPMDEFVEFQMLISKTQSIWVNAKRQNNFELFKPSLEKIVMMMKKQIKYLETDELKGYNVLLDQYEEGMKTTDYDAFFDTLRKDLVPFVMDVIKTKPKTFALEKKTYPVSLQKEFANYLIGVFDYNQDYGLIKESEHPFTSGVSTTDVRITSHYYEDHFTSSIFSTIHEMGHALYEQQVNPEFNGTRLAGGASMALHESQSRFYENIIGRSLHFWKAHYARLQAIFSEQLKDVSLEEFYQFINKAEASYIRTEADELTYSLHIMVRYEIERDLMEDKISVSELPEVWNRKMEEYLGITPRNDREGVLQDVHWSAGLIGYFPTYALGSAYSAQIYQIMLKDLDIEKELATGTTKGINLWLKDKIHKYGQSLPPVEVFEKAVGAKFNPSYYVRYLKNKYSRINIPE